MIAPMLVEAEDPNQPVKKKDVTYIVSTKLVVACMFVMKLCYVISCHVTLHDLIETFLIDCGGIKMYSSCCDTLLWVNEVQC